MGLLESISVKAHSLPNSSSVSLSSCLPLYLGPTPPSLPSLPLSITSYNSCQGVDKALVPAIYLLSLEYSATLGFSRMPVEAFSDHPPFNKPSSVGYIPSGRDMP